MNTEVSLSYCHSLDYYILQQCNLVSCKQAMWQSVAAISVSWDVVYLPQRPHEKTDHTRS